MLFLTLVAAGVFVVVLWNALQRSTRGSEIEKTEEFRLAHEARILAFRTENNTNDN
jgi:hypothetical protein